MSEENQPAPVRAELVQAEPVSIWTGGIKFKSYEIFLFGFMVGMLLASGVFYYIMGP